MAAEDEDAPPVYRLEVDRAWVIRPHHFGVLLKEDIGFATLDRGWWPSEAAARRRIGKLEAKRARNEAWAAAEIRIEQS